MTANKYNGLIMPFGQFLSHDMMKTTLLPNAPCTTCQDIIGRCFNVKTDPSDPK